MVITYVYITAMRASCCKKHLKYEMAITGHLRIGADRGSQMVVKLMQIHDVLVVVLFKLNIVKFSYKFAILISIRIIHNN